MKAFICDQDGTRVEPDPYDIPPQGWYSVSVRGQALYRTLHFCSAACLLQFAGNEIAAAVPADPPPPAPEVEVTDVS